MQAQHEPEKKGDDSSKNHEESLYRAIRDSEKEKETTRYKARKYFRKWPNRISALTLFFVIAYTAITFCVFEEARQQTKISTKALIGIERAAIHVEAPSPFTIGSGTQKIAFSIENLGKQVATVFLLNAAFSIQRDTMPPQGEIDPKNWCSFYVIGERALKPNQSQAFTCETKSIDGLDATALIKRSAYGFFRVETIYSDPLTNTRTADWLFLLRPQGDSGRFVQVFSEEEETPTEMSSQARAAGQRVLVNMMLKLEREKGPLQDQ